MSFYSGALANLILPLGDMVTGRSFMSELRYYRQLTKLTSDEIKKIQKEKLAALLSHASQNVPYYKGLNIPQRTADPESWLKEFPILTKKIIRSNMDNMLFGNKEEMVRHVSSGSSGFQGEVYMTKRNESTQQAVQTHWWEWAGYRLGDPILQTGITPNRSFLKRTKDRLFKTLYISAFALDQESLYKLFNENDLSKYKYFMGYASSLYTVAQYAKESGINDIHFEAAVSWGDKLFPHYKELIEKQFRTRVFDTYGCSEGLMIAGECAEGKMHIMTSQVYIEIVDEEGNEVPPGTLGRVLATRLDNFAMPLIRYYIGDLAIVADPEKRCGCGKPYPMLEKVIGRDTDIVKTRSGRSMIVHFFTGIFEFYPEIKQFRVIQRDLDSMEIEYVKDTGFHNSILDKVTKDIENHLGETFPVKFSEVESIPDTPSGKPQIIQSFIINQP